MNVSEYNLLNTIKIHPSISYIYDLISIRNKDYTDLYIYLTKKGEVSSLEITIIYVSRTAF